MSTAAPHRLQIHSGQFPSCDSVHGGCSKTVTDAQLRQKLSRTGTP
jgi:hypothetical protein